MLVIKISQMRNEIDENEYLKKINNIQKLPDLIKQTLSFEY